MWHGLRLVTLKPKPSTEALRGKRRRVRSDRAVSNGEETRWSSDYGFTPIRFA